MTAKEIIKLTWLPVFFAGLCCFAPVVLVLFGLGTATLAASLSDILYFQFKWVFRLAGLALLMASLVMYFRKKKGICTIDEAKKKRQEIINTVLLVLIVAIAGYVIWLYVVVEIIGYFLGIWDL